MSYSRSQRRRTAVYPGPNEDQETQDGGDKARMPGVGVDLGGPSEVCAALESEDSEPGAAATGLPNFPFEEKRSACQACSTYRACRAWSACTPSWSG